MLTKFWEWVDNRTVFRRLVVGVLLWATWDITNKLIAFGYAVLENKADLTGAGLMLAAVTAPWSYVIKEAFVLYSAARNKEVP